VTPLLLIFEGDDVSRSLFLFAEGRPLGEKGLVWLKLHLINLTEMKKRDPCEVRLLFANEVLTRQFCFYQRCCWWLGAFARKIGFIRLFLIFVLHGHANEPKVLFWMKRCCSMETVFISLANSFNIQPRLFSVVVYFVTNAFCGWVPKIS